MADGSVIIGVSLDTTMFYRSIELLETRVDGLSGSMSASLSSAFSGEKLFVAVDSAFRRIASAASENFTDIYQTIADSADSATLYFSNADWSGCGSAATANIASGMLLGLPAITNAVSEIIAKINSAFSSGMNAVGRNISSGIAQGMLESSGEITGAANKVSSGVVDTFKNKLQIASPSALMRDEVGAMISRGIAEGITGGASFVGNAISSVYAETESAYSRRAGDKDRSNSLTQNIYLRDSDFSPYRTAKKIKRESEAIFDL